MQEDNTSVEEKRREESFTESPKAINRVTLIVGIATAIFVIIGILFFAGVFSTTDERGTQNVNVETNGNIGP